MNDDLHDRAAKWCKGRTYFGAETLITELDAALRAAETEIATAHTLTRDYIDAVNMRDRITGAARQEVAETKLESWLASVAAAPTAPDHDP